MHYIAHSSASISAWRDERLARTFLAPNSPSKPSRVLSQPCPEKISFSFQEPSVKHHLPVIDGRVVTSMCCTFLCSFNICVSAQSVVSVSAKLSVSLGSMSRLLKTLLFLPFQIYDSIHANWWSSICGKTLQKRWSMFVNSELVGKLAGFDGIFERAQNWSVEGHSKNTWFIDSSSAPHLAQRISPCIPLACRFFLTAIHVVTNCHRKCFIFGGHRIFQQNAFNISTVGPNINGGLSLWVNPFYLISWFNRIFSIVCEMSSIPMYHLSSAQWYVFYNFHIM